MGNCLEHLGQVEDHLVNKVIKLPLESPRKGRDDRTRCHSETTVFCSLNEFSSNVLSPEMGSKPRDGPDRCQHRAVHQYLICIFSLRRCQVGVLWREEASCPCQSERGRKDLEREASDTETGHKQISGDPSR